MSAPFGSDARPATEPFIGRRCHAANAMKPDFKRVRTRPAVDREILGWVTTMGASQFILTGLTLLVPRLPLGWLWLAVGLVVGWGAFRSERHKLRRQQSEA